MSLNKQCRALGCNSLPKLKGPIPFGQIETFEGVNPKGGAYMTGGAANYRGEPNGFSDSPDVPINAATVAFAIREAGSIYYDAKHGFAPRVDPDTERREWLIMFGIVACVYVYANRSKR